jgi:peptidoglycan/xylan/chitin deacetylase (PgdA/CDA1 family)
VAGLRLVCSRDDLAGRRLLALTFDDGPGDCTAPILDLLGEHAARATFFVLGRYADERPELVARARAEGHELGNHTYDHPDAAHVKDDAELRGQLARTSAAIRLAAGVEPRLVRPPYGKEPCRLGRLAAELGLEPTVLWSVQSWDWESPAEQDGVVERVLAGAAPGAIVLLHDGVPPGEEGSRAATVRALAEILPELRGRGYELVTVSELLAA